MWRGSFFFFFLFWRGGAGGSFQVAKWLETAAIYPASPPRLSSCCCCRSWRGRRWKGGDACHAAESATPAWSDGEAQTQKGEVWGVWSAEWNVGRLPGEFRLSWAPKNFVSCQLAGWKGGRSHCEVIYLLPVCISGRRLKWLKHA